FEAVAHFLGEQWALQHFVGANRTSLHDLTTSPLVDHDDAVCGRCRESSAQSVDDRKVSPIHVDDHNVDVWQALLKIVKLERGDIAVAKLRSPTRSLPVDDGSNRQSHDVHLPLDADTRIANRCLRNVTALEGCAPKGAMRR